MTTINAFVSTNPPVMLITVQCVIGNKHKSYKSLLWFIIVPIYDSDGIMSCEIFDDLKCLVI